MQKKATHLTVCFQTNDKGKCACSTLIQFLMYFLSVAALMHVF